MTTKEFVPKPLLNVKALNSSTKNDSVSYTDKDLMQSTYSGNMGENSHFLSNTQKIQKTHYAVANSSIHEDGKSFLNSTLNGSNYNSNTMTDSRNA